MSVVVILYCVTGYKLPDLRAVVIHSAQNLWRHSLVVMVWVNISRQMGQVSSDWRSLGEIIIFVLSVMASCGVLCSSYRDRSQFFPESSVMV